MEKNTIAVNESEQCAGNSKVKRLKERQEIGHVVEQKRPKYTTNGKSNSCKFRFVGAMTLPLPLTTYARRSSDAAVSGRGPTFII
jgi:hypothetical protein